MIKKSDKIICACISMMMERYHGRFELKHVLFTRDEIYDRVLALFRTGKFSTYEFTKYVVGNGTDWDENCLIQEDIPSLLPYFRVIRPQCYVANNIGGERIAEILLSSEWENHTEFRTDEEIAQFADRYFNFRMNRAEQVQNDQIITREAIWLAAAALTYNEFHRTHSNQPESYQFPQSTIAKVANSFNKKNELNTCRQMTRESCTEGKSDQPYAYLVDTGGVLRDSRRRISYFGEYEFTQPDVHKEFNIETITGIVTGGELEAFIRDVYSPIFYTSIIEPLDQTHSMEEMEEQAAHMDFASLKAAASRHGEEHPAPVEITTSGYQRDPYISRYAKIRANGRCQLCGNEAPFSNANGEPYLETHHVIWLSEGGADTLDNVVALCPNCHRKMHVVHDPEDIEILKRANIQTENN